MLCLAQVAGEAASSVLKVTAALMGNIATETPSMGMGMANGY